MGTPGQARTHLPWSMVALASLATACTLTHEMETISPCNPDRGSVEATWLGPADAGEREAAAIRCRTVAPPIARPFPRARFDVPTPQDSVAVFSWNIDVGAGDMLAFFEEEIGLSCKGAESEASRSFPHFVVLVQEAVRRDDGLPPLDDPSLAGQKRTHDPRPGGDPDILGLADICGLALWYVPSGRNGIDKRGERPADKGNAILSSLPLSDLLAVEHPFETERKVTMGATLSIPGSTPLRIVNAHLEVTSSFLRTLLTGNRTHLRQVNGILEALNAHESEDGRKLPTLLGGDFNTWSGRDSAIRKLRVAFPDSPEWDRKTTRGVFPTDHLFFRKAPGSGGEGEGAFEFVQASYRRIENRYGSDHHGRFAWVRLGG